MERTKVQGYLRRRIDKAKMRPKRWLRASKELKDLMVDDSIRDWEVCTKSSSKKERVTQKWERPLRGVGEAQCG